MSKDNFVPKLDLAPKLKRPLSLWNPFDYLRLLYWSIFFPQAFTWYLKNWAGGDIPITLTNIPKRWRLRFQNSDRRNLLLQELILIVFLAGLLSVLYAFFDYGHELFAFFDDIRDGLLFLFIGSSLFGFFLNLIGNIGLGIRGTLAFGVAFGEATRVTLNLALSVELNEASGVSLGVALGVALGMVFGMAFGVAFSVVLGMAFGVALGVAYDVALIVAFGVTSGRSFSLLYGMAFSLALGVAFGITKFIFCGLTNQIISSMAFSLALSVSLGMTLNIVSKVALGATLNIVSRVALGIALGVAFITVFWNPINWIVGLIFNPLKSQDSAWKFPHVTLLPNVRLLSQLQKWLQQDWAVGVHNVNQILEYTLQSSHVVPPIRRVLIKFPDEQVTYRVNQLVEGTNNWQLIRSLVRFDSRLYSLATVNGFWYLHEKKPEKATEAFNVVRNLLYGEEVFILAQTLTSFKRAETSDSIANLTISNFPIENLLRPATWQTMNKLQRVVEDTKLIQHSASRNTKTFAYSRAIGELTEVIDNKDNIPEAERALIVEIAETWKLSLERIGKYIGNITITQPVTNPYVIGNPVEGSLFVGREDILRQLEELWITSQQLQSVVLYGHRRMGKTSILKNFVNCTGAEVKVIYVNLQRLGAVSQGVAEVLMTISDEINDEIAAVSDISPPDDDKFLQFPKRHFRNYLKQVISTMPYKGLIIALDEFEFIEELIDEGQIEKSFMGYLRVLIQMDSAKVAFAFAGLHTLEEMTANYFEPFYASVIPIPVSFLNKGATKTILANPNPENQEFLLDYTGEALDLIYDLTSGQPYLLQLIGFQLVRNYNDYVFERGITRDNTFTIKDVEAIIDRQFFQQGRYYFEGVWGQAAQGAIGQQEIIKALASQRQGLNTDSLAAATNLDTKTIEAAIATLIRHDVIIEKNGNYCLIVKLFQRWVNEFNKDS